MISFGKNKNKNKKKAAAPAAGAVNSERLTRLKVDALKRVVDGIRIGSRIRYHQEYEEQVVLENLVVGYRINKQFVFLQKNLEIIDDEAVPKVVIHRDGGSEVLSSLESVQLVIPSADEKSKMDYDSLANIGSRGVLTARSRLTVMSTLASSEHLKVDSEVERNLKLTEGIHSGLQVALLSLMLGTLEEHEPRAETRIATELPVSICKNGTELLLPGLLLDFSESAMRLKLANSEDKWPEFLKKDYALITMRPNPSKPSVSLRGRCIKSRQGERVFETYEVERDGKSVPFSMIDALELKVDLLNSGGG